MTSPATTTAGPTIPSDFRGDAGCLGAMDLWVWSYDGPGRDARTVMGGPSQTTACLPTKGDPTGTYAASQCPPQWKPACTDTAADNGAVTCCPEAHDFSCIDKPLTAPHASFFRCSSQWGTSATQTLRVTDMIKGGQRLQTATQKPNQHLFALGIVYQTPPPESSGTANPDSTASSSSSTGLSTGASAGIGAGVGIGVIALVGVGLLLFRRRRNRAKSTQEQPELAASPQDTPHTYNGATPTTMAQSENYGHWDNNHNMKTMGTMGGGGSAVPTTTSSPGPPPLHEMPPGTQVRYEMDGNTHSRAEMPGQ